jgi:flagellar hook protein FlgE
MTPPAGGTPPNGYAQIQLSNGNSSTPATVDLVLDLSKATQNSLNFGVTSISQNGYAAGILSGVTVDKDGIIQAAYTNGQQQAMGQLALVGFSAPNALQSVGNNQWAATAAAGKQPSFAPGQGGLGAVQSGAVEESNVDLTKELVNMITQQRAYQANAQSIKTQDQIMQTIVNLR